MKKLHVAQISYDMSLQEVVSLIPESIRPVLTFVFNKTYIITDTTGNNILVNEFDVENDSLNISFVLAEVLGEKIHSKMFRVACACCIPSTYMENLIEICKEKGITTLHMANPHLIREPAQTFIVEEAKSVSCAVIGYGNLI